MTLNFKDIPKLVEIENSKTKQYGVFFLFEKPDACFTVLELLDPDFETVTETVIIGKRKRNLKVGIFNFRGMKCAAIGLAGHIISSKFKRSKNVPEYRYDWNLIGGTKATQEMNKKILEVIGNYVYESKDIVICTDDDDEGELVAYSVLKGLGLDPYKYRRIRTYTFRNKDLFLEKLDDSSELSPGLINATMTRHVLDMVWGKNFSRLLGRGIDTLSRGIHLSIGRVQTPTLRFIHDQFKEIKNFESETSYSASVKFLRKNGVDIRVKGWHSFDEENELDTFISSNQFKKFYALQIEEMREETLPEPLYNTDEALMDIEYDLDIPVSEGFDILKSLYRGGAGVLSYPRTSSTNLPPGSYTVMIDELQSKGWIGNNGGEELEAIGYAKLKGSPTTVGKSEGDHPGLHPVAVPDKLSYKTAKVFELIARRFVATFGPPKVTTVRKFILCPITETGDVDYPDSEDTGFFLYDIFAYAEKLKECWDSEDYFCVQTDETIYLGHELITDPHAEEEENKMKEGEGILVITKNVTESTPPYPLSERDLLSKMIKNNLGTDATRPSTIQNIQKWDFCGKIKDQLYLSELGEKILMACMKVAELITKPELTRKFEEYLESIRSEKIAPQEVLNEAEKQITSIISKMDITTFIEILQFELCPKCESKTGLIRYMDNPINIFCKNKDCRYSRPLG